MVLDTGNQAIDPDKIVIPFTQDVYVTFLYEGAGFENRIWRELYEDAVDLAGDWLERDGNRSIRFISMSDDNKRRWCLDGNGDGNWIGLGSFPIDEKIDRHGQAQDSFCGRIEGGTKDMKMYFVSIIDNGGAEWCVFTAKREWNDHGSSQSILHGP